MKSISDPTIDVKAIAAFAVEDSPALYSRVDEATLCTLLGITATISWRISLGQYNVGSVDDEEYYPIDVIRLVYNKILAKRNQTWAEYKDHIVQQNRQKTNPRRYGGTPNPNRIAKQTLNKVVDIIHQLTRNQPKATNQKSD